MDGPQSHSCIGSPGPFLYLGGGELHALVAAGHARGRVAAPAQRSGASKMPPKVHKSLDAVRHVPRILDLWHGRPYARPGHAATLHAGRLVG